MVLAKFAAEYILNWVPRGTHDWNRFIKPSNLNAMMGQHGFSEILRAGIVFDPIRLRWIKSRDDSINYIASFARK